MFSRLRTALSLVALSAFALSLSACGGDEEEPNAAPSVVSARALCGFVSGTMVLTFVQVVVEDTDGVADLGEAEMVVEATRLEPMVSADEDNNRVTYTWRQAEDADSDELIFCGDDGALLTVEFEVRDTAGFPTQETRLPTSQGTP